MTIQITHTTRVSLLSPTRPCCSSVLMGRDGLVTWLQDQGMAVGLTCMAKPVP